MSAAHDLLASGEVTWEGDEAGLAPYLTPAGDDAIARLSAADVETLRAALADPELFVLAHVGLTRLTGIQFESFPLWNGLAVEIDAGGRIAIEPGQRADIARRWERWFASEPRPGRLPA